MTLKISAKQSVVFCLCDNNEPIVWSAIRVLCPTFHTICFKALTIDLETKLLYFKYFSLYFRFFFCKYSKVWK